MVSSSAVSLPPATPVGIRYEPDLGVWRSRFDRAALAFRDGIEAGVAALAELVPPDGGDGMSSAAASAAFAASLLIDIARAGGHVRLRDSRLWVAWPDWNQDDATTREGIRRALLAVRAVSPRAYQSPLPREAALRFLSEMRLRLAVVSGDNSPLADVFRLGVTTWSMPYRGREGRARRFVAVGRVGGFEVPIGLLEVGDDAPLNPVRDRVCGFGYAPNGATANEGFESWLSSNPQGPEVLADRLASIRAMLLPCAPFDAAAPLAELEANLPGIWAAGLGRSGPREEVHVKKRITYLARLVAGESAFRRREVVGPGARDGLRVLRDITIPRIQVEATVCGALPPFNEILGGKLVAALLVHPDVRSVVSADLGEITLGVFRPAVKGLLPPHGAVLVTTRGLYSGHSAMYNNVRLPGIAGAVRVRHAGYTSGSTTSLLGDQTARLAERVMSFVGGAHVISREYGSGGAKRQRTIERAASRIGLPPSVIHPKLRRPVYVAPLVANLPGVALTNALPSWVIDPDRTADEYCADALDEWRRRWLPVAERRWKLRDPSGALQAVPGRDKDN